jgi:uncharacterized membrane protein YkvA (DUF1232 family)
VNLNELKARVTEAIAHELRTGAFRQVLWQASLAQQIPPNPAAIEQLTDLTARYVQASVEMLESMQDGVAGTNITVEDVRPLIDAAELYFLSVNDRLPDFHGLGGLLDDAYFVWTWLIELDRSAWPPEGLQVHQTIRQLLGEPYASDLESMAREKLSAPWAVALKQKPFLPVSQFNPPGEPPPPPAVDTVPALPPENRGIVKRFRPSKPVSLVFSYAHEDELHRKELEKHLRGLQRDGWIKPWHDRMIPTGDNWRKQIDDNFRTADVIVLLISADFMDSNFCSEQEMTLALERRDRGEAVVVPIIVRACDWKHSTLGDIQALSDGVAVTSQPNKDETWSEVARGIRRAIEALDARRR